MQEFVDPPYQVQASAPEQAVEVLCAEQGTAMPLQLPSSEPSFLPRQYPTAAALPLNVLPSLNTNVQVPALQQVS